jgi:acetyl-CoA acyltransferase 2
MGLTAENLAKQNGISRQDCDAFALRSQLAYEAAHKAGVFEAELAPIEVKGKKGPVVFSKDEHPRAGLTIEALEKLKPVFDPKAGVVTAGNASGINDGAGAIIIASEAAVKAHGLTPLARIVSYGVTGCDPSIMGIGPVNAIKKALASAKLTLKDMDRVEINEAFASQYIACEKQLGLDRSKANVNGGAIAIGHPLGASGSRITAHLAHELKRTNLRYGVGSACIGGGQGIAIILERC